MLCLQSGQMVLKTLWKGGQASKEITDDNSQSSDST